MQNETVKAQLLAWVDDNRDRLIEEFKQFLRIPSLTGYEGEAQKYVQAQYEKLGLEVDVFEPDVKELFEKYPEVAQYPTSWEPELDLVIRYPDICTYEQLAESGYADKLNYKGRPNVVGVWKGTGGGRSLILNGHVDTVTLGDLSRWEHEPLGGEQVGDRIYGRGTSDMKGGLLCCMKVVEALQAAGVKLRGDVILESCVNEEHAGNGTLACVARGYTADAAICTDTTGFRKVMTRTGGGVYWEIRIKGFEAHTAARWRGREMYGVSAIEKAGPILVALCEQERLVNEDGTKFSLGIGTISGGTYATATARECVISGVVYFSPDLGTGAAGIRRVKAMLRAAIDEVSAKDPWLSENKPELSFLHYDDAYICPENHALTGILQRAGEEAFGEAPAVSSAGACDARHLGNQGGIPTVVYGPGELAVCHAVNEYVTAEDLINSLKTLILTVYDWCK